MSVLQVYMLCMHICNEISKYGEQESAIMFLSLLSSLLMTSSLSSSSFLFLFLFLSPLLLLLFLFVLLFLFLFENHVAIYGVYMR